MLLLLILLLHYIELRNFCFMVIIEFYLLLTCPVGGWVFGWVSGGDGGRVGVGFGWWSGGWLFI